MLLVFYAVFIKETLYKYNVISVLCYFSSQGQKKFFTVKKNFFKGLPLKIKGKSLEIKGKSLKSPRALT
jgi:hypothetical protein